MNEKIKKLIEQMTLEEKISLLAGSDIWHTSAVSRLGIPAIKVTDGPYGARTQADNNSDHTYPATCFPTGVAMAATWDVNLVQRIGEVLGDETRERACAVLLGPCVNIHRTPLGGRNFESFSEDPFLSSNITVAFIQGVQSRQVGVSVKHFALNNQEFARFSISSEVGERAIREIFFPSFEKAVKVAGAWTAMCSYNKINGTHASENRWLLSKILKEEWGFEGLVMSDWFATHSTVEAANAGLDLEMPGPARFFGRDLVSAVKQGRVSLEVINDKVSRILSVVEKSGAFDKPAKKVQIKNTAVRRKLARQSAAESFVLLKNDGRPLPLKKSKIKTLAVIGPNAAQACVEGGGSSMVKPHYKVSPLEALKKVCENKIKIRFEAGCRSNRLTPVLPARFLISKPGKTGLKAEFFANNDFRGRATTERIDRNFHFRWFGDKPPARNISFDNFSARWSGDFRAPVSGKYKFGILTQGWARILLDSKEIVSTRGLSFASDFDIAEENTGECELQAGKVYPFSIEYQKNPDQKSL
ncbi:MAG TPA: glycoside hydrolase family 3 N-terminal domain-containing protein, partial [Dehalococcoidales bacterium]|nr:glycoside hydrolase family 3 N-terminal domain-containing protein [Dehalococcoidales bacterium]